MVQREQLEHLQVSREPAGVDLVDRDQVGSDGTPNPLVHHPAAHDVLEHLRLAEVDGQLHRSQAVGHHHGVGTQSDQVVVHLFVPVGGDRVQHGVARVLVDHAQVHALHLTPRQPAVDDQLVVHV
eukprot:7095758-Prymnesium_polylepis.1